MLAIVRRLDLMLILIETGRSRAIRKRACQKEWLIAFYGRVGWRRRMKLQGIKKGIMEMAEWSFS